MELIHPSTQLILLSLVLTGLATAADGRPPKLKMTTDIPASITAPDEVKTSIGTLEYFGG